MADENAIDVFERKILRAIFGPKNEGDLFRSRNNAELYQLFNEESTSQQITLGRA
jgi:hypothetical protein